MVLRVIATIVPCAQTVSPPAMFERFREIDRASYEYASIEPPPALVALAACVTERALRPVSARLIRMLPGDYLLAHHDHAHDDHRVEVILDLSPGIVPDAEVRYRRNGAVFFRFPSRPHAASIVERDAATQCYHTYVSKLHRDAIVLRLVLLLV
jgi:hypothetical protein